MSPKRDVVLGDRTGMSSRGIAQITGRVVDGDFDHLGIE